MRNFYLKLHNEEDENAPNDGEGPKWKKRMRVWLQTFVYSCKENVEKMQK